MHDCCICVHCCHLGFCYHGGVLITGKLQSAVQTLLHCRLKWLGQWHACPNITECTECKHYTQMVMRCIASSFDRLSRKSMSIESDLDNSNSRVGVYSMY